MLLLLLTIPLLVWAVSQGRVYLFVLVASFFGGALIELFTIMEQEIGDFYHSQATLMVLGNREPVYMLVGDIVGVEEVRKRRIYTY